MADLTPNNREEYWLKGMVDGQTTLEPNKRREYWYKEIVDAIGSGGGGGGGALITNLTYDEGENTLTADKTWKELHDAALAGSPILAYDQDGNTLRIYNCVSFSTENSEYSVEFLVQGMGSIFNTPTETGYPVLHIQ